jgi:hypothetical protein
MEEGLMLGGLELKTETKIEKIEEMAKTLSETRERALEGLRKVIGF